jgi:hypothetical protein
MVARLAVSSIRLGGKLMKRARSKLTYANVISTLALFLVIAGGSAFAAGKLGKNTVGTRQIKNNAITTAKIKDGAVTGSKIATSSLGTVPSATNAAHATTADTASRATTADSATSAGNAQTVGGKTAAQITAESKVTCPAGMKAQSGLCFETSPRPANLLATAIFVCSAEGLWMPTLGQLLAYERHYETSAPPAEWSEPITWDGTTDQWAYVASGVMASGGLPSAANFSVAKASTEHPYRCVSAPTN